MPMRMTASTEALVRDGVRLVQDIRAASGGTLDQHACAVLAAGILSRDTHGEKLYEHVPDAAPAPRR